MRPELSRALIEKALGKKDRASVNELVLALTPIIRCNVIRVLVRRRAEAQYRSLAQDVDDLTQETFAFLIADGGRKLLLWNESYGSPATFFGLLTRRNVLNILASKKKNPWTETPVENWKLDGDASKPCSLEQTILTRDFLGRLTEEFRAELNERDKKLFKLMYVEQAEDGRVKEELGIGSDALYKARSRLLQRARVLAERLLTEERQVVGVGR